ncbi:MAG TPA: glycosyl hydrolase family 18 protein [Feifaniaceae bacterium]|nr:glycosyl hydrolase family 18 protein [Feifaniaceae bacterium]
MQEYVVQSGDTLYSISREFGITPALILLANPSVTDPQQLPVGITLNIPETPQNAMLISVNGYAFPTIDMDVLRRTLPYLTYLSIFSYQVLPTGSLTPIEDADLIVTAREANVAPLMVITNIGEEGSFSSDLAHTILTDSALQDTLLNNVVNTLKSKNYFGLDVDFEYIYPADGPAYVRFLERAAARIRPLGYIITTALAPKTSAEQQGILYEAHNYPAIGSLMDHIILMTYEWGHTYGPPMAVAPANQVRRVLEYATNVIEPEKILMGMPNYGYDWTLPYVQGRAARSISFAQAVELAQEHNAQIQFDPQAQAPYFFYEDGGVRHVVWFDNRASLRARYELVAEFNLGGVSFWTINRFSPESYGVLSAMFQIQKVI